MAPSYPRQLQFSDCHGCNVVLGENRKVSEGKYIRAQGQLITRPPLAQNRPLELMLMGTGILKLNTFPTRTQAVDWVRSKQPLPQGCRRIRLSGTVLYTVVIPPPGQCVLVESTRGTRRELFTLEAGPTTTLAFDIEYGSIVLYVSTQASGVAFDTFCCSSHVDISSTLGIASATLRHYNPSSLCCLEDTPLATGDMFRLDVTGSRDSKDTGSYIRVCVAKQLMPYENNGQTLSIETDAYPYKKSRRILIVPTVFEQLFVRVTSEGIRVCRNMSTEAADSVIFQLQHDHTLWFELHKVSLRVFQLSGQDSQEPHSSFITCPVVNADLPPRKIPPPLPPKPTFGRQHPSRPESKQPRKRHHNKPAVTRTGNSEHNSETSSCDGTEYNLQNSWKTHSTYVSADTLSPSPYRNNAANANFQVGAGSCTSVGATTHDRICDSCFDTSPPVSINLDLITLSSTDSLDLACVQSDQEDPQIKCSPDKSHYEIPEPIWSKSKSKYPNLKTKDSRETPAEDLTFPKDAGGFSKLKASHRSFLNSHIKDPLCESAMLDGSSSSSAGVDFVKGSSSSGHIKMSTSLTQTGKMNRNELAKKCVGYVQKNSSFIEGCHLRRSERTSKNTINGEENVVRVQSTRVVDRLSNGTGVPTSSVWLQEQDDDGDESVQHCLDITIVPIQGNLNCCSYYSDGRSSHNYLSFTQADSNEAYLTLLSNPSPIFHDSVISRDIYETQLKTIHSDSSRSASNDISTNDDSVTFLKVSGSNGFLVDDDNIQDTISDVSDDITHLKSLAQQKSPTDRPTSLQKPESPTNTSNEVSPKLCTHQSISEYCLAGPISPKLLDNQFNGSKSQTTDSNKNQAQQDNSDNREHDKDFEEYFKDLTDVTEGMISTEGSDKDNNQKKDEINAYDEIESLRYYHWRQKRRNITESMISNTSKATLIIGPMIQLPDDIDNLPNS